MVKKDFKSNILHYKNKLEYIEKLFDVKNLTISLDILNKEETTNYELIYFNTRNEEKKGIFVFSYPFFLKELKDQEFKRELGDNYLNFQIHDAYLELLRHNKLSKFVSMNEIISSIMKKENKDQNDLIFKNKLLKRIMLLAYYHNWDLKKSKKSIDSDFLIIIPKNFRKIKQRFNLKVAIDIVENNNILLYINSKGDIILVLKGKTEIRKDDIEGIVTKIIKKNFKIGEITIKN